MDKRTHEAQKRKSDKVLQRKQGWGELREEENLLKHTVLEKAIVIPSTLYAN